MSKLTGTNFIGPRESCQGSVKFRAWDPRSGVALDTEFAEAASAEIEAAARQADKASAPCASVPATRRAAFLRAIAEQLEALGDELLERAEAETALGRSRLTGERLRTANQARLFGDVVEEGSWVDARIDPPLPNRQPIPRPDLRRMLVPLGPAAVFGASNFPLAFSVAGGDTVSALAAGCPVIVKAHPAHPGTSELAARAILAAARETGMPTGIFSMLHGLSPAVGQTLVGRPEVQVVGFTGSSRAGRALFDVAARRPQPIPVHAEMGSANPVFVLPGALAARGEEIARALTASITLGCGQFCTNPGLTFVLRSPESDRFLEILGGQLEGCPAGTMVHTGIKEAYDTDLGAVLAMPGVSLAARSSGEGPNEATTARPALLAVDQVAWRAQPRLGEEIYGPATIAVRCDSAEELLDAARALRGHLTATVHGTERDLAEHGALLSTLARKVGRLIVGGMPTGVEVGHAMHHGGPWPASTDPRATSVGSAAILRFARPICFQDMPEAALPEELRDANPRGIWRMVGGKRTQGPL